MRSRQITMPFANRAANDAGGLRAKGKTGAAAKRFQLGAREHGIDARHGLDEILDHAVGFWMANIEPRQFAVRDDIDAGEFLRFHHDHDGVTKIDGIRQSPQPIGNGIAADDRCTYGSSHFIYSCGSSDVFQRAIGMNCVTSSSNATPNGELTTESRASSPLTMRRDGQPLAVRSYRSP